MNKKLLCISLMSSSLALASCGGSQTSQGASQSSVSHDTDLWSDKEIALMEKYCGTVLPNPYSLTGEYMTVQEVGKNNNKHLLITNASSIWSIENYYLMLKESGWDIVTPYGGDVIQTQDGTKFVEATRVSEDGKSGYELMYYHVDDDDNSTSYNCIACYNYFSGTDDKKTSWSAEEASSIEYVTSTSLPALPLGSDYSFTASSETEINIYDYCAKDFTSTYLTALEDDGFALDEENSKKNGCYYVVKNLTEGGKIEILIQYYRGNNINIYYTPELTAYSTWPSEFTKPEEDGAGVSIPSFPISKGGTYVCYELHNVKYIITYNLDESYDYYDYVDIVDSELFSWDEKLSIAGYLLRDDDSNDTGFCLTFALSNPSSTFTTSWPKEAIQSGLKSSLGIENVDIPEIDLASYNLDKPIKYKVQGEEDYNYWYNYYLEMLEAYYGDTYSESSIKSMAEDYASSKITKGVSIKVYDPLCDTQIDFVTRFKINEAYKAALYQAGWYKVPDCGGTTYEDPTGQVAIEVLSTPYSSESYTCITIKAGSGTAHSPTIAFSKQNYEAANGSKLSLGLEINMLPYEVSYSSSDTSGNISVDSSGVVSVSESASDGESATITASCTDSKGETYSATCTITVVKLMTYKTVLEDVQTLLEAQGYTSFDKEDIYAIGSTTKVVGERLNANLGADKTKSEVKSMIKDYAVPEQFTSTLWSSYSDDFYSQVPSSSSYKQAGLKKNKSSSTKSDLEYLYCFYNVDYAHFMLYYYLYTADNGDIMLYVESRSVTK